MLLLPTTVFLGLIISQALAYGHEWWNVTWSTRYLLPSLPLLIVATVPLIDRIVIQNDRRKILAFSVFVLFCVLIQLGNVLVSPALYTIYQFEYLADLFPSAAIWEPAQSAIIGQWKWILEGRELNIAWIRGIGTNPIGISLTIAALIGAVLTSAVILIRNSKPRHNHITTSRVQTFLQLAALGLIPLMVLSATKYDSYYHYGQDNIESLKETLISELEPQDAIVLDPYLSGIWQYFLNFNFVDSVVYSMPLPETGQIESQSREVREWKRRNLISKLTDGFERVWIITESPENSSTHFKENRYFIENANVDYSESFSGDEILTLSLYTFK